MLELVAAVISISSFLGILLIIFRKIPVLAEFPEEAGPSLFSKLKEASQKLNIFKDFSTEIFLQKILSKIRILSLRTDNKTSNWLQRLRKRSQQKKLEENDKYWEEVKKSTNQNNKNFPG